MLEPLAVEPVVLSPAMPVRIERVRREPDAPAAARFAHFHHAEEIVLFDEVDGLLFADDARFALTPACGVRLSALAAHDFALSAGRSTWTLIQYYHDFALKARPARPRCVRFTASEQRRLACLCDRLAEAVTAGLVQEARCYLELVNLAIDRAPAIAPDGVAPAFGLSRFRPFLEHLRDQPSAALSLADAASLCHLSPAYFSRLFRQVFGQGFADYVTHMRLKQAAVRLTSTSASVSEIGFAVGFSSHAYFTARFRQRFGVTPSAFRARAEARAGVVAEARRFIDDDPVRSRRR